MSIVSEKFKFLLLTYTDILKFKLNYKNPCYENLIMNIIFCFYCSCSLCLKNLTIENTKKTLNHTHYKCEMTIKC